VGGGPFPHSTYVRGATVTEKLLDPSARIMYYLNPLTGKYEPFMGVVNILDSSDGQVLVDYLAGTLPIYIGRAAAGQATKAAVWSIRKVTYDANYNVTSIKFAQGVDAYNYVWDSRATYTYA
jgi:hypothetical protein